MRGPRITLAEIRKRLGKLPPIDWLAIAEERRRRPRMTPKQVAALQKAGRKARERKRRAALERRLAARKEVTRRKQHPRPLRNREAIALAMRPGEWWARPDILAALPGTPYGAIKVTTGRMEAAGLLERTSNPEWRPYAYRKGQPIDQMLERPPRWLYRLTAEGVALRESLAWLG